MDAMVDFTGGCPESFCLAELRGLGAGRDLFSALLDSYAHNSLICCSITGGSGGCETKKSNGLVTGHAYSVTKVSDNKPDSNNYLLGCEGGRPGVCASSEPVG